MKKENLKKLKKHVYKLYKLLELGQPNHFSWCLAISKEWKAIAEMWSKPSENSVFFIEYLFQGKWCIAHSLNYIFFTSREAAKKYVKTVMKGREKLISALPLRVQEYARVPETRKMSETKATVMVDYPIPDRYYAEDTEWVIEPNEMHDSGVLAAKLGAIPVNMKEKR